MLGSVLGLAIAVSQPAFSRYELHRLVEASARAITDRQGNIHGEALGRFDTPLGEARAFRTDFVQGQFRRRYVFLIEPKDAARGPMSVMLTSDPALDAIAQARGGPAPIFLDLYTCNTHATLNMLAHEPSYEELRAIIVAKLQGDSAISSTQANGGDGRCMYGRAALPGLERP